MYIKTGDNVQVISGKEKGRTGKVIRVDRRRDRVYVEGTNLVRRHTRPTPLNPSGGIVEKEAPIHVSNVLLFSASLSRGVRVSYRFVGSGGEYHATRKAASESFGAEGGRVRKVRMCVKTGEVFE